MFGYTSAYHGSILKGGRISYQPILASLNIEFAALTSAKEFRVALLVHFL